MQMFGLIKLQYIRSEIIQYSDKHTKIPKFTKYKTNQATIKLQELTASDDGAGAEANTGADADADAELSALGKLPSA